ncbi:alpha/beta hydrolase [Streptomyces sp. NPDC005890]|uniref:alpha/beta fold hydrolase n=1 Tax=Streptomyces sp. NPDC005890 TaxID=3154568 RepID=UPI0033DFA7A2
MPTLAERYEVIAVDYRGMGTSDKPETGYDKKTMAHDIYELIRHLGHERVHIAGEDIGSMIAYAFAASHPDATIKLALWEVGPRARSSTNCACCPSPASRTCGGSPSTRSTTARKAASRPLPPPDRLPHRHRSPRPRRHRRSQPRDLRRRLRAARRGTRLQRLVPDLRP